MWWGNMHFFKKTLVLQESFLALFCFVYRAVYSGVYDFTKTDSMAVLW